MGHTKYMMSGGLAFAEEKDMEKLRQKSLKGWHIKRFRFMGYELEQGDPEDFIYSIDYRTLQSNETDEYVEMFADADWTYVCTGPHMHIFKARSGAKPIYSDQETTIDKIGRLANPLFKIVAFLIAVTIIVALMMTFTSGLVQSISEWAFFLSIVLTVPAIMTYVATFYRKWKKVTSK